MSKKLTDPELERFEQDREVWQEVLEGVRQIKQGEYGRKFAKQRPEILKEVLG